MRIFKICFVLSLVVCCAKISLGQYGLYGSPDSINITPQNPATTPYSSYPTTSSSYPATSNAYSPPTNYSTRQPVQTYPAQQSQQSQPYTAQQVQPYAQQAQPAQSVTTYNQTGPQYRTQAYSRPYYMAGAESAATQSTAGQPSLPAPSAMPGQQTSSGAQGSISEPMMAPGIQQNSGVTSQMLAEQGQGNSCYAAGADTCPPNGGQCGSYRPYVNSFQQSACDYMTNCSEASLWYASISALVMSRDRPNKVYITYETGNLPHNDYPVDELSWRWGGEVRFGRRFCSGCNPGYWALEASYWTLDDFHGYVSHTSTPSLPDNPDGTVGTPLTVGYNDFYYWPNDFRENATNWFDNAQEHRLWRRDEVHNVEVNLVRGQWCYGQDSPWDLGFALGVRYFRFEESWKMGSLAGPNFRPTGDPPTRHNWGDQGGLYEAYLDEKITNDLVGPQLGFELGYNMWSNFRFFMTPKVGIYNNHITNYFNAYLGNGEISQPTAASKMTEGYPANSRIDTIAFLTQVDVGLDWQFAKQWGVQVGYRLVTISGIGLADAQIPFYIVDVPAIKEIDRNGDLILHGAFVTLSYNF